MKVTKKREEKLRIEIETKKFNLIKSKYESHAGKEFDESVQFKLVKGDEKEEWYFEETLLITFFGIDVEVSGNKIKVNLKYK